MTKFQKAILKAVEENSGGLKMFELIAELAANKETIPTPEFLEKEIRKIPQLGILEYAGPVVADGAVRLKQFVYRKFLAFDVQVPPRGRRKRKVAKVGLKEVVS